MNEKMNFLILDSKKYDLVRERYLIGERFFPLIAAVLNQEQGGLVFANDYKNPEIFFVEHKFGFSQIFGEDNILFFEALKKYLLCDQLFTPQKIRLYTPNHSFLFNGYAEISERCQFRLKDDFKLIINSYPDHLNIEDVTEENVEEINQCFNLDLFNRFWDCKDDFLKKALPKILRYRNKPVSICYASTVSNQIAEIDVATLEKFRRYDFGKYVSSAFIRSCLDNGIIPNWDCFTNNLGSMRLALSLGFQKYGEPYPFFTINKKNGEL